MAVVAPQSPASVGFLVLMEESARSGICPVEGERIVGHDRSSQANLGNSQYLLCAKTQTSVQTHSSHEKPGCS